MTVRTEFESEDIRPPRRSGRGTLLVALCVVAASAGGLFAAWHLTGRHGDNGAVPIIRADDRPVKVPPANPGGMEVPDQDLYVLNNRTPTDTRVEQLLPPPETPLPRPAPPTPAPAPAAALPPTVAAPAANAEALAPPPVAVPAPQPAPLASAPVAAPASEPPASVMPVAPPLALAQAAPAAAATGGYRLQVAAMRSPELAKEEWTKLKRAQHDILGALDEQTVRVDLGEHGIFYRIVAGPIADAAAAQRACETLKQRKVGCILVKP